MKIIGLIPFWKDKKNNRDIKKLSGKFLIEHSINLLRQVTLLDDIIIYSSSDEIFKKLKNDTGITYKQRPTHLDYEETKIEEIIIEFFKENTADIIVLMHPYTPFIKKETLIECVENVMNNQYDSAFTAKELKKFAWYMGQPLNFTREEYSTKLNKISPVVIEQGLIYVITKKAFLQTPCRVGTNPYIKFIDNFQGMEVNTNEDFAMAELIINSGLFNGN